MANQLSFQFRLRRLPISIRGEAKKAKAPDKPLIMGSNSLSGLKSMAHTSGKYRLYWKKYPGLISE
jgi:hypothetical protein